MAYLLLLLISAAWVGCSEVSGSKNDQGNYKEAKDGGDSQLFGGLTVSIRAADQMIDLFGESGHRFWIEVSDDQLLALNQAKPFNFSGGGDIYRPGVVDIETNVSVADSDANPAEPVPDTAAERVADSDVFYANHLVVQDAVTQSVADYGKVEIGLVGESTFRLWDKRQIPNLRIDSNEFEKETKIGGFEHLRLNNSLVGTIFRENIAHRIYRALDYPAVRSSHVFLGSNVWGDDVWVPMTLMEMYKRRFCLDNTELLGGSCDNMWEFQGDIGFGGDIGREIFEGNFPELDSLCQVNSCDNTRLQEVQAVLASTPAGAGFKKALDPFIDWRRYHEFQCLSWILWTFDDSIHTTHNNLIVERDTDHRLIWAPYSVDISLGFANDFTIPPQTSVMLTGNNTISIGCQRDPICWADTIATCEELIVRFDGLNPETFVDELVITLTELKMMRSGDEERAKALREWLVWRQTVLADELELFRYLPDEVRNCPMGLVLCPDITCGTPEQCAGRVCAQGQQPCEVLGRCIYTMKELCPVCEGATPFYCEPKDECIEDLEECSAE